MKNNKISSSSRLLFILSGLALLIILQVPLWQIQLSAPQYPEGLVLLIFTNKLGGNVDIINGLNHYIGMKPIHASDFVEFSILPYLVAFYSILFILTGFAGKRKLMNFSYVLFVCFGIVAMIDFWKWEYNYGHTLNPDAAIVVPGMSYQPPLIGFKQLLNFGAYSIPDIGGWIFVGVGVVLLFVTGREWFQLKKIRNAIKFPPALIMSLIVLFCTSCNTAPAPLILGKDNCQFCTMTISDARFGAEIITDKGKTLKFDDPDCALSFLNSDAGRAVSVRNIYFTNFCGGHELIDSKNAIFLKSGLLKAPMGGEWSCFNNPDSLKKVMNKYPGTITNWHEVYNK
jgi:copper chaperone NosL